MGLNNKRGAIELSMTTIIVIVIGVTLLILGLTWIKSTFTKITKITDEAFTSAENIIPTGEKDPKLTVPGSITMKRGESKKIDIYLINDGSTDSEDFNVKITNPDANKGIQLILLDSDGNTEKEVKIPIGEELTLRVGIFVDKTAKIKPYDYSIRANNGDYDSKGFILTVEK